MLIFVFQSRCSNGKMTKKEMLKCYKDLSTCDMDKIEHVVNAIYQTFDTDNDGKVGMYHSFSIIVVRCLYSNYYRF
jgi:Ca2+-binding EF-hand superfamily protein